MSDPVVSIAEIARHAHATAARGSSPIFCPFEGGTPAAQQWREFYFEKRKTISRGTHLPKHINSDHAG